MDKGDRILEWDGTSMGEGLDAGKVEVVYRNARGGAEISPRRVVGIDDETGSARLLDYHRHVSVLLRRVPALPPMTDGLRLWSAALVEARLRRVYEIFRALPGASDIRPAGHKSCMPRPVLDRLTDYAPDRPVRVRPTKEEIDLADRTYGWLLDAVFDPSDSTRLVLLEAVGTARPWRLVARDLRRRSDTQSMSYNGAKARARKLAGEVAAAWTSKEHEFDELDIRLAYALHGAGESVIH